MREYDFALSFAKEDRQYAEKLADLLKAGGHSVFYDKYEQAQLLGKDLYQHLSSVYKDQARYCVIFLSKHYARKLWTKHELQSAQARAFQESQEYILPIRLDDTEIAGILPTVGHIDLREMDIERAYHVLLAKLSGTASQGTTIDTPTAAEYYFQSLESFELRHSKKAQECHVYLKAFVAGTARKESIKALVDFADKTNGRVLLIHSQGGIGKTRFVLESLKQVKEQNKAINILFNKRQRYVNVNEIIPEITEEQESVIVFDDAHLIDNLTDFENILLERNLAKIILITRSSAKESVKQSVGYPAEEMELTPLDRESSIELLKGNMEKPLRDEHLRYSAQICEGNPLLIGIATHLISTGTIQSFGALKTDKLIKDYLETILAELKQSNWADRHLYEPYLALLFLLRPFAVNDAETRSLIRSLMEINENQEGRLLLDLEQCAVLERHGDTLWLYTDLLGEYLVEQTFFSDIPILNFDGIFRRMPPSNIKSVFSTLREIGSSKASQFLKKWTHDLANEVESQNNYMLSNSLELLEIIVPEVTDEVLQIIDFLLNPANEKPPWTSEDEWFPVTRDYSDVLWQCLRILEHSHLRYFNSDDVLGRCLKIYFYKPESKKSVVLRKKALEVIAITAAYNLDIWTRDRDYSIQTKLFEKVQGLKQENLEKYFTPILHVCGELLRTEMASEYSDSEGFGWSFGPVAITDGLISLRRNVISLLQEIYDKMPGLQQRIEVVRTLDCATNYPSHGQYRKDMKTMIRDNGNTLMHFYLVLVARTPPPEVEILQEIEKQANHLKEWHQEDIELINQLLSALQSDEPYQLYRTLVGDESLFWREEGKSYDQVQIETDEKIKEIADAITHDNLIEWITKLSAIAETISHTPDQDFSRFFKLLFKIGKDKPKVAQYLIDYSLLQNNALKRFAAECIRGVRESKHPDIAGNYVREWLSGKDQKLILQIPRTYSHVDEGSLEARDVEVFDNLFHRKMVDKKQRQELDELIMSNIGWIYKKNPEKITEIICQLFKRGHQDSIIHHLSQLRWSREQIDLSQWDLSVFESLLQTFVDIPVLNDNAIYILARYAQRAPLGLVRFFERRVEQHKRTNGNFSRYDPIPHFLKEIADVYRDHPQYVDVLNQILTWFKKHDYHYDKAAANLISSISPQLDAPLKQTLMELIKSGDKENILAVLKVLEELPEDSVSYELCKEVVNYSEGQKQLQHEISNLIVNRVRTYVGLGGAVTTFQNLKERLVPWLEDENNYVRAFAQRIIPKIESRIEFERGRAAEDKITIRKGLR